jgi:polysaccharide pyruvyl transferase WcaK-like protein
LDFATLFKFKDSRGVDSVFTSDVYEYLSILRKAKFLVSFRLHATLPAISFGTPLVNLSYDERASSLIRDLDVEASNINLVEEKENLSLLLEKKIREGGFVAPPHIRQKWKLFREDQLAQFLQFKTMVTDYIEQVSDRRE